MTQKIKNIRRVRKKQPPRSKFNPRPYSEEVLADYALKYDRYKRFWIYDKHSGIWKSEAEVKLNSILRKKILGEEHYKRYCVQEIIEDLRGLTYTDEKTEEPELHLIPFQNKIYDLDSGKLLDYHPNYFFINKLPVKINTKNRRCPTIDRIFSEFVSPKDVVSLYEILAYMLYRDYPYHKVFILYGKGNNGKTTYIKIVEKVISTDNISSVSLNDLQYNRFASSRLFGKLANVSGEMDYDVLKKTSKFKEACGQDLMTCERKFRRPFPFRNHAKMVFLTNEIPLTEDKSEAFYRRIFLVEFPNKFILRENADPMLVEKIPQEEFEGLAWKCLRIFKKLRKKDFIFSCHQATQHVAKQYENLSNPLDNFLREKTERNANEHILVGELGDKFNAYLEKKQLRLWSMTKIGKAMKQKGFAQTPLSGLSKDGKRIVNRAWSGLKWK